MDHLRFAGRGLEAQREALIEIISSDDVLVQILRGIDQMGLPDGLLVSGAIYNRSGTR